jgi:serine protease inhibitor
VRYLATESFSAALIPYEGERFGLLVLLPVPSKSIAELLAELSSDSLLSQVLARKPRTFGVTLPKFTLTSRVDMASFLKLQGAERAFEAGNRFPAFARNASLTQVVQSTMIQVDEKGTRAAAATFAGGGGLGGATELRADRPFIFMVVDTSLGTVLFAGVCANP